MKTLQTIARTVLLSTAAMLLSCGEKQPAEKPQTTEKILVMVPKFLHPYYEPCYQGFKDAAEKYGVKTEYRAAKAAKVTNQVEVIENLIARKVDGIAISALDDQALVPVIQEATDAGIKVICFDAPAPSSKALCYIGTMNEAAGYSGGEMMAKYMEGEGEVAVLQGGLGATNLNERYNGFERALKEKAPKIKIVAREDVGGGRMDIVVNKTETLLQAYPNLKAIFAVSAEGAPGASAVLKERGKAGKILLGGFDDLPDTLAAIKDGTVQFCIAQKTYKMGWLSVEKLLDAIAGKPLPKEIDTGVLIITKDNVDTYMEEMRKEFQDVKGK
ncbi:MAG: sugar-binding protein [Candidatus Sumerlaeia bacterium]|nr:sugar-binding protein [Candidatus Sumerlaeia bacterium]